MSADDTSLPHSGQKLASFLYPQCGQNCALAEISCPHSLHLISGITQLPFCMVMMIRETTLLISSVFMFSSFEPTISSFPSTTVA